MDEDSYATYQKKIFALAFNPENPLFLLDFMSFLLYQGLGKEALAVFKRTLDIIKTSPYHQLTVHDSSMCHILSSKMSRR